MSSFTIPSASKPRARALQSIVPAYVVVVPARRTGFRPRPGLRSSGMQVLTTLDESRIAELRARDEFFWLDLTGPSDSDFETLARLLELSDLALDDLGEFKHSRALLHPYGDYMLLVYFAARHRRDAGASASDMLIEVHLLVSGAVS